MTSHLEEKKDFLYSLIECIVYLSNNIKKFIKEQKVLIKKFYF